MASEHRTRNLPQQLALEHVSPATRLLEKRRQMFEVQEALDAQKEEYKRREAEFKRREEKLKERDLALQESLIKFNKFLQENDSKKARAEKKEKDEMKQRVAKEGEIARLRETLDKLRRDKVEMQGVVAKDMRYTHFLEAVVELKTDEFPDINEVLNRHETLSATHHDLVERSRQGQVHAGDQAQFNKRYHKDKVDEILEYNNQIALLQQKYEAVVKEANKLQAETDRRLQDAAESTLQLGQVLMACDNIYTRCMQTSSVNRKKLSTSEDDKDAAIDKLHQIKEYLGDLMHICKTVKPAEARTDTAGQGVATDAGGTGAASTAGGGGGGGGAPGGGAARDRSAALLTSSANLGATGASGTSSHAVSSKAKAGRRSHLGSGLIPPGPGGGVGGAASVVTVTSASPNASMSGVAGGSVHLGVGGSATADAP